MTYSILIILFQSELKDDTYVYVSRPYNALNDQLHHWNAEGERYKGLTDSLQVSLTNLFSFFIYMNCQVVLFV